MFGLYLIEKSLPCKKLLRTGESFAKLKRKRDQLQNNTKSKTEYYAVLIVEDLNGR